MSEPTSPLKITYDCEMLSRTERELPLVIGVMGDFVGTSDESLSPLRDRRFIDVNLENFDSAIRSVKPRITFEVENCLNGGNVLPVDIIFETWSEFSPDAVLQKVEPLRELLRVRHRLTNPSESTIDSRFSSMEHDSVAEIDRELTLQLNKILHHEDFLKLEATWRGLHFLVSKLDSSDNAKIRILQCTKRELAITFHKFKGQRWDQSPIFKNIYDCEFGVCGGEPYTCLIGDYSFDHCATDLVTLKGMAKIAAEAHMCFITSPAPSLFSMIDWAELNNPVNLKAIFQRAEYAEWRSFRESEDAKYVGMAMPRFLGRVPSDPRANPTHSFNYEEGFEILRHEEYCWINSAYAMGAVMIESFKRFGICTHIRGTETGGIVKGVLAHAFPTSDATSGKRRPTEIFIDQRREMELSDLGMLPLSHWPQTDMAFFYGSQSLQEPSDCDDDIDAACAKLLARFPFLLLISRVAHYIKVIAQEYRASLSNSDQLEELLNEWIRRYVGTDPDPSYQNRIDQPLSFAEVSVGKSGEAPNSWVARINLEKVDSGLVAQLSLKTRLPHLALG